MKNKYEIEIEEVDQYLYGMYHGRAIARIGTTDDGYELYIFDFEEINIPHFHYCKRDDKSYSFLTFIRLDKAEYLDHGNGYDVLSDSQKENLIKFLNSKNLYFDDVSKTNWNIALCMWNMDTNGRLDDIDEDTKMPNYNKLQKVIEDKVDKNY